MPFTYLLDVSFPHSPQAVTERDISRCWVALLASIGMGRSTVVSPELAKVDKEPASCSTQRSGVTQKDRQLTRVRGP